MPLTRLPIHEFLHLLPQGPLFDVRSPGEYGHAHIPGAISLPLFSDEERKEIGTAYKQKSRETAVKIGLDYFGPKLRPLVETVEKALRQYRKERRIPPGTDVPVLLYCWRGGMRSGAVAWLLEFYGFTVCTLEGGYKMFRRQVLENFKQPYRLQLLGGFTGSGKTELLRGLHGQGELVIDLEELASHKGSAFGNIGMPDQPSQEMFENKLSEALRAQGPAILENGDKRVWLEDESQRIGHVNIPHDFWNTMRKAPLFFLDIPFEERLRHIVAEYGSLDRERMLHAIGRISKNLGPQHAKEAAILLENGDTIGSFRILLKYYDKFYVKAMHNREGLETLLHQVTTNTVSLENIHILLRKTRAALV